MTSLSSTVKETDSPWVPSRSVVSNVKIFISGIWRQNVAKLHHFAAFWSLFGSQNRLFFRHPYFLLFLQESHHFPQLAADLFDGLLARCFPHGQEILAAGLVFLDPLPRKFARLHFLQDLFHFLAGLLIDHPRAASIVAVLGRIGDGVAHVGEAALLD